MADVTWCLKDWKDEMGKNLTKDSRLRCRHREKISTDGCSSGDPVCFAWSDWEKKPASERLERDRSAKPQMRMHATPLHVTLPLLQGCQTKVLKARCPPYLRCFPAAAHPSQMNGSCRAAGDLFTGTAALEDWSLTSLLYCLSCLCLSLVALC